MARPRYTRVAVAQLDFVPAAEIHHRSPLEDPLFELGKPDSLLPDSGAVPPELHEPLAQLRARVRQAYLSQYWLKLRAVVSACQRWEVQLLVLPEYSVPWELLPEMATEANKMVVVAGTHAVERGATKAKVYAQLGWAEPVTRAMAVSPVLHRGLLIALVPKLSAARPEQGSLQIGRTWAPVDTGGVTGPGFAGPMGVMICLDFLFREREAHREFVAPGLDQARFLAVPSYTPWYSLPEFEAKAWEEARRYGRPVLYANVASHGGSSLFVDEGGIVDLRRFPDHAGYLERGDEGVIVADVDLGYQWTGRSTRYDEEPVVRPFAAASLIYRHLPLAERYAGWWVELDAGLDDLDLDDALDQIGGQRELLLDAGSLAGAKIRKARLERLLLDLDRVPTHGDLRRFLAEVVLPPDAVPLSMLRATMAAGALECVKEWAGKHRGVGLEEVERRLRKGSEPVQQFERATWTESGVRALAEIAAAVRGESDSANRRVSEISKPMIPRDVVLPAFDRTRNGFELLFRASPDQLVRHLDPKETEVRIGPLPSEVWELMPPELRQLTEPDGSYILKDLIGLRINLPRDPELEHLFLIRRALGDGQVSVIVATVEGKMVGGLVVESAGGVRRLYAPAFSGRTEPKLHHALAEAIAAECEGVDPQVISVGADAHRDARAQLRGRFAGAKPKVDQLVAQRLRELDRQSVELRVLVESEADTIVGMRGLDAWLASSTRPALLLGPVGSGKSTLIGQWCQTLWATTERCPIFVDLSGARGSDPLGLLLEAAGCNPASQSDRAALALLLRTGDVIACFDGFDEMATNVGFADLSHRLAELFAVARNGGKVLVSSRDHYFTSQGSANTVALEAMSEAGIQGLWRATVQPLSEVLVEELVGKVKGDDADAVLAKIATTYPLRDLVQTPLLLSVVLRTIDEIDPDARVGRATIYERYLDRWLEQAEIGSQEMFSRERKRSFAEQLARELWRDGASSIPWVELHRAVKQHMSEYMPDDLPRESAFLEVQGGAFFVWEGAESFRFAHKSFLEFFFAKSLLGDLAKEDVVDALTTRPITPEVGAFVAELLRVAGTGRRHPAITAVERWMVGGRSIAAAGVLETRKAAANALRLLREVGRQFGDQQGWVPESADLREVELRGEDLRRLSLRRAELSKAMLVDANLEGADLHGATLVNVRMAGARLWHTQLDEARVEGGELLQVEAHGTSLRGAVLIRADLRQSSWTACDWSGAQLEDVLVGPTLSDGPILDPSAGDRQPPTWLAGSALSTGHTDLVMSVAWSPDGERLASGALNGTVRVWNAADGRELANLEGHRSVVTSVAWSPDGRRLASSSFDGTVRVWNTEDGREIAIYEGHTDLVRSVAWSLDGERLASGSDDGTVRVWNADREVAKLEGHTDMVRWVVWSPDGERLASGSDDGTVRVWTTDGTEFIQLKDHADGVISVAWAPDGERLISGSGDGTVRLWNVADGHELAKHECHANWLMSMAWSPDGEWLALGSRDGTVRVWSAADGREVAKLEGHTEWVRSVAWSPDGERLASGSEDRTVRVWRAVDWCELAKLEGHANRMTPVSWSPDGERFAFGSHDGTLRVWNAADGREVAKLKGHTDWASSVSWSPNGERLASGSPDGSVRIWSADDGSELDRLRHTDGVSSVSWSPDGKRLASGSHDNIVRVWSADDGRELAEFEGRTIWRSAVAWSPDGELLASGSHDNTVRVWSADDGRELAKFEGHTNPVRAVAWSPDGKLLASSSNDRTVRLWNTADGRELAKFEGHTDWVNSVVWSPDGERLASGSHDGTVRLWSADGRELAKLEGHTGWVSSVAWAPDGERLASGSRDGTVRLWSAANWRELAVIEFIAGTMLVRASTGHFLIHEVGAARPMLAVSAAGSRSVFYLPLAGLREHQHPEGIAAALRGVQGPTLMETIGWSEARPWDGQVRRLTSLTASRGSPQPQLAVSLTNPFQPGPPLVGRDQLPGRQRELSSLRSAVLRPGVVLLLGPRRVGKTSMLRTLRHLQPERPVLECNLQAAPSQLRSTADLARLILGSTDAQADPVRLFTDLVIEQRPLLLIDEVGVLASLEIEDAVYGWLRSLGQDHASIVYTGSRHDWNRVMERVKRTPFGSSFGNEAFLIELGEIPRDDAITFLADTAPEHAPIPTDPVAKWVVELCGAWPFYLQAMGHALVEEHVHGRRLAALSKSDVVELMREHLLRRWSHQFVSRWKDLPAEVRRILARELIGAVERKRHALPGWNDLARSERRNLRDAGLLQRDGWQLDRPFLQWLFENADDLDGEERDES